MQICLSTFFFFREGICWLSLLATITNLKVKYDSLLASCLPDFGSVLLFRQEDNFYLTQRCIVRTFHYFLKNRHFILPNRNIRNIFVSSLSFNLPLCGLMKLNAIW